MRFEFAKWLTKETDFHANMNKGKPIPMRVMFGRIMRETEKCYVIEVQGKPEPATHCLHCMRTLTNKVSRYYGLGPTCGKHFYITNITEANLKQHFDDIRKKLSAVTWRGFIPKNSVQMTHEEKVKIAFMYKGKSYIVTTTDETKVQEILTKSDTILSKTVVKV